MPSLEPALASQGTQVLVLTSSVSHDFACNPAEAFGASPLCVHPRRQQLGASVTLAFTVIFLPGLPPLYPFYQISDFERSQQGREFGSIDLLFMVPMLHSRSEDLANKAGTIPN